MNSRVILVFGVFIACSPFRTNDQYQLRKGETCEAIGSCATGLVCNRNAECAPIGTQGTQLADDNCQTDEECALGLICDALGTCGLDLPTKPGDPCSRADGCADGLVCSSSGECVTEGSDGTRLLGEDCDDTSDCAFGFACDFANTCAAFPRWNGVACSGNAIESEPHIAFQLSGSNTGNIDFFSTPFPNSIRENSGHVDYSNFPGLGTMGAPGETLTKYTQLLEASRQGFSPNATITTRFNVPVDFPTLKFGGSESNFRFVDLTFGEPGYGLSPRSRFFATGGRDKY
ncbi:MAG: hypothetical protein ACPGQS_10725, partial [Bradymonadia bacterium]